MTVRTLPGSSARRHRLAADGLRLRVRRPDEPSVSRRQHADRMTVVDPVARAEHVDLLIVGAWLSGIGAVLAWNIAREGRTPSDAELGDDQPDAAAAFY